MSIFHEGPEMLYCLNCPDFDELILMKIVRIVATRCQIWCPPISPNPISPNPNSPNPYMLGLGIGLELGLRIGLGIGLGSRFDYFRQYNVIRRIGMRRNGIRRIGIRRNGAEPQIF